MPEPAILVEDAVKRWRSGGELHEVRLPRLEVAPGERVALMGASGSGKTTLLNLVGGLLTPDAGRVVVAGVEVSALGEAARDRFRAEHVGYLFQTFHLLDGYTALENVELGAAFTRRLRRGARERAEALLRRLGLGERLHHPPSRLSIGQQARASATRALVDHPAVLLADEPTGALDEASAAVVLDLVLDSAAEVGATVLCATHDPEVAAAFDRIVHLGAAGPPPSRSDGRSGR